MIIVRGETAKDFEHIRDVIMQAFGREAEEVLVQLIRQGTTYLPELALVAEESGSIVGFVLFSKILILDDTNPAVESLALAPVAVHPEFQNKGIGQLLISAGLTKAKQLGHSSVIVLGSPKYYHRFGFAEASEWGISCPYEVPSEVFMVLHLQDDALDHISGMVQYPDAFNQV